MWQDDTIVRNINLQSAWFKGHSAVLSVLCKSPLYEEKYDFDTIFFVDGINPQCVFGGRKYPGINQEDDGHWIDGEQPIVSSMPESIPLAGLPAAFEDVEGETTQEPVKGCTRESKIEMY